MTTIIKDDEGNEYIEIKQEHEEEVIRETQQAMIEAMDCASKEVQE